MKFIYIAFKNLLPTSQKAHHVTVTKIIWLMLCEEIIAMYSGTRMKSTNITYVNILTPEIGCTCNYLCVLIKNYGKLRLARLH
jgi:hypothetical protein